MTLRLLRADPFLEPGQHGLMPLDAVVGTKHPMVFVREVEELAGNAAALERRERLDSLGHRQPEVELAVDDEHRRRPPVHQESRIETLVELRIRVRRAPELPFRKPQLFSAVVGRTRIEDPVVVDETLEIVPTISSTTRKS